MDVLSMMNFKDENGNFNPAALIGQIDKIEPMLPMLDGLMQTFKPEGSDGVFLMGSIESTKEGPRPVLRLIGFKVVVETDEEGNAIKDEEGKPKKNMQVTENCVNEKGEALKFDLLALIKTAGGEGPKTSGDGLQEVLN